MAGSQGPVEKPVTPRGQENFKLTKKENISEGKILVKKILALSFLVVMLAAAPLFAAGPEKDIVDTAAAAGSFKTLVAAVQAAGLVETLKGKGPFTVFAPTDEAFAKLPSGTLESLLKPENKDKLKGILTYHVVPGKVMAKDVVGLKEAKTVNGQMLTITVKDGKVMVDKANVVKTDVAASNGVIHVIDAVVMPK